jgi:hypothetical protein
MKTKHNELDKDYDILDDKNCAYQAVLEESDRKIEILEEENAELKQRAGILDDGIEGAEEMDVDITEGFQHQEKEEVLVLCEDWARSDKCRYGGAG